MSTPKSTADELRDLVAKYDEENAPWPIRNEADVLEACRSAARAGNISVHIEGEFLPVRALDLTARHFKTAHGLDFVGSVVQHPVDGALHRYVIIWGYE